MDTTDKPVLRLKYKLQKILDSVKTHENTIESPIPDQGILEDLKELRTWLNGEIAQDFRFCLECAAKDILYEIVVGLPSVMSFISQSAAAANKTTFDLTHYEQILKNIQTRHRNHEDVFWPLFHFFDIILLITENDLCDQTLPLSLVEETLDTQTIDGCQRVFEYLESRFERLTLGVEGNKGKGLILLRLSNELLRRLSKSEDTVFCGRILVFLSKSFPLSERSGVNLRGEFNVDNVTNYEKLVESNEMAELPDASDTMDTFSQQEQFDQTKPQSSQPSDLTDESTRYTSFWSLQNDFAEPTRLFQKENFEHFKTCLASTLQMFKSITDEQAQQGVSIVKSERGASEGDRSGNDENLDHYNPKYLTSRELFNLEIRDLVFRRHVLVQSFILVEFLLSLSADSKKKWEPDAKNRAVQYTFTLAGDDLQWAEECRRDISVALQQQKGMDGLLFSRTVDSVLTREKNWVKWKADNCVSFEKAPLPSDEMENSSNGAIDSSRLPNALGEGLGAAALSKVWVENSTIGNLCDLKEIERYRIPEYDSFQKKIDAAELDMDFASPEEKDDLAGVMQSVTWRALRVASKDRFHIFNKLDDDLALKSLINAEQNLIKEKKHERMGGQTKDVKTEEGIAL